MCGLDGDSHMWQPIRWTMSEKYGKSKSRWESAQSVRRCVVIHQDLECIISKCCFCLFHTTNYWPIRAVNEHTQTVSLVTSSQTVRTLLGPLPLTLPLIWTPQDTTYHTLDLSYDQRQIMQLDHSNVASPGTASVRTARTSESPQHRARTFYWVPRMGGLYPFFARVRNNIN